MPKNYMPEPRENQKCDRCHINKAHTIFKKQALCPACLNANTPGYERMERERFFCGLRAINYESGSIHVRSRKIMEQRTDSIAGSGALILGS